MITLLIGIIMIAISFSILYYCTNKYFYFKTINKDIDNQNNEIDKLNKELINKKEKLQEQYNNESEKLVSIQNYINNLKNTAQQAFESYCDNLDNNYEKEEKEYENAKNLLKKSYEKLQQNILQNLDIAQKDLDKIRATRAAAIEAQIKEKEIQEQQDFYCLKLTDDELSDIHTLEKVKSKLHQPRILCMLIWSTYFQKPMTTLCNNILGTNTVIGIYKITNQTNSMCYIGQSVDISRRWKDHAKCGLGIDTPIKNKLYKAMQEDGLENFSWELLEICNKELLNEKEKFYINLYQSDKFGYNSNIGIG